MQTKAATLDADQVLFDLEDATAPSEKAGARAIAVESLRSLDFGPRCVSVRVNGVDTQWCYRDVVEVIEAVGDRLDTVILPKAESPADVFFLDRLLGQIELSRGWSPGRIGIEVLIESAAGLQQVDDIARASSRLEALIFGPGDLSASLGLDQLTIGTLESDYTADIWHYALMRILVAARVNGLLAIDGPYAAFADLPASSVPPAAPPPWASTASGSFTPARSRPSTASTRPTPPPTPAPKASSPPTARPPNQKAAAPSATKAK